MKTKLKFIDANDTDGSNLLKCHYVYDVLNNGHHEVRIPGDVAMYDHTKYLKDYSYKHYENHGLIGRIRNLFS